MHICAELEKTLGFESFHIFSVLPFFFFFNNKNVPETKRLIFIHTGFKSKDIGRMYGCVCVCFWPHTCLEDSQLG